MFKTNIYRGFTRESTRVLMGSPLHLKKEAPLGRSREVHGYSKYKKKSRRQFCLYVIRGDRRVELLSEEAIHLSGVLRERVFYAWAISDRRERRLEGDALSLS